MCRKRIIPSQRPSRDETCEARLYDEKGERKNEGEVSPHMLKNKKAKIGEGNKISLGRD